MYHIYHLTAYYLGPRPLYFQPFFQINRNRLVWSKNEKRKLRRLYKLHTSNWKTKKESIYFLNCLGNILWMMQLWKEKSSVVSVENMFTYIFTSQLDFRFMVASRKSGRQSFLKMVSTVGNPRSCLPQLKQREKILRIY